MSSEVYKKASGASWLQKPIPILIMLGVQLVMAYGIATKGLSVGILGIALPIVISFVLAVMLYPQIGFYTLFFRPLSSWGPAGMCPPNGG
jgi:hypothetical protein